MRHPDLIPISDELYELRAEVNEQARLLGMSGSREAKLQSRIAALEGLAELWRSEILKATPFTANQVSVIANLLKAHAAVNKAFGVEHETR